MSQLNSVVVEALSDVLSALDKPLHDDLMRRIGAELENRPIVTYMNDQPRSVFEEHEIDLTDREGKPIQAVNEEGALLWEDQERTRPIYAKRRSWVPVDAVNTWRIGEKSPTDRSCTIFAMALHESMPAVYVYTAREAQTEDGSERERATEYFREIVRNFTVVQGPATGKALYLDLCNMMRDDDEEIAAMVDRLIEMSHDEPRYAKIAEQLAALLEEEATPPAQQQQNGRA